MTEGRSQSAREMTKRDKYPADLHGLFVLAEHEEMMVDLPLEG